ncbi:MAG: hypothetical protein JRJ39_11245 [Deltaproteobacteria bacterium]|nr:hypothetical protein [Deltaproteobacteria bacterium]MBW1846427.1 hypothetical protein [Deltaproteobacteria bacterium]MBW2180625.1 hypothetical protein [Deltaproteobacteria bacterium]MBW2363905.1 hypothetical protein [Deltaproteobacteria bacterium]
MKGVEDEAHFEVNYRCFHYRNFMARQFFINAPKKSEQNNIQKQTDLINEETRVNQEYLKTENEKEKDFFNLINNLKKNGDIDNAGKFIEVYQQSFWYIAQVN